MKNLTGLHGEVILIYVSYMCLLPSRGQKQQLLLPELTHTALWQACGKHEGETDDWTVWREQRTVISRQIEQIHLLNRFVLFRANLNCSATSAIPYLTIVIKENPTYAPLLLIPKCNFLTTTHIWRFINRLHTYSSVWYLTTQPELYNMKQDTNMDWMQWNALQHGQKISNKDIKTHKKAKLEMISL